jgi:hypothetical protein
MSNLAQSNAKYAISNDKRQAASGQGGNALLRERAPENFRFSIPHGLQAPGMLGMESGFFSMAILPAWEH